MDKNRAEASKIIAEKAKLDPKLVQDVLTNI